MKVQHWQSNWAQINIFAVILPIATGATIVASMTVPVYADSVVIIQQGTPINSPQPIDVPLGVYQSPIVAPTIINPNIDGYGNQPLGIPSYIYGGPILAPTFQNPNTNFDSRRGESYRAPNNAPSYIYGSPIPVPTHVDIGNNFDRNGNRYRAPNNAPSYIYGSPIPLPTHVDLGNNFDRNGNRYRAPSKN